jgi:hypothetical protein
MKNKYPPYAFSGSESLSHHLVYALDEINSASLKIDGIRKKLVEKVDEIRSDLKSEIISMYAREKISALYVESLFRLFNLERD